MVDKQHFWNKVIQLFGWKAKFRGEVYAAWRAKYNKNGIITGNYHWAGIGS